MRTALFRPLRLGPCTLAHRVVMAPLTRMRATVPGNVPNALNAEYYRQRTTNGGLIVSEASQIVPEGQGVPASPGIHSREQIAGWRGVTEAVHAGGGKIFLQLWHVGRISHPSHQPGGGLPVAPSAIAAEGMALTSTFGREPFPTPRALLRDEIPGLVGAYEQAARNAQEAGFDGVEIHAANGYLLEQFLQTRSNHRNDEYGGSVENRCRLPLEVARAVASVWGPERVGIRLSPFGIANDSGEDDPMPLYAHLVRALDTLGLAYLHLIEPRASGAGQKEVDHQNVPSACELFRPLWSRVLVTAGNFTGDSAEETVSRGFADAIAFGRRFISNPDLPGRLRHGSELAPYDRATFYGGGARGYTDYPPLA
ncbi:MAG: alkene reductase [Betaproteobacteria bacterium]|nr:alkene reductase [Betaproteobacteria bacterium]